MTKSNVRLPDDRIPAESDVMAGQSSTTPTRRKSRRNGGNGGSDDEQLRALLRGLRALKAGDFSFRIPDDGNGRLGEIRDAFNELASLNDRMATEVTRVSRVVGREGRMTERAALGPVEGSWASQLDSMNSLIGDLVRPTTEVARVIIAVAEGDLSQKMALEIEGKPVKGEFLRIGTTVNTMVDQLGSFAAEVTRVAKEVGTEGKLGGQAQVPG
jgi:methyl-accepting chemotaxis protein